MYRRILLPISGKKRGHNVMDALVRALHVSTDGEFILLHVCVPESGPAGSDGQNEISQDEQARAMLLMGPAIEYLRADGRNFYTRVVSGNPVECIITVADEEDADLIVVLNDGDKAPDSPAPGSTAESVLRNTMRDVLVLRPQARERLKPDKI